MLLTFCRLRHLALATACALPALSFASAPADAFVRTYDFEFTDYEAGFPPSQTPGPSSVTGSFTIDTSLGTPNPFGPLHGPVSAVTTSLGAGYGPSYSFILGPLGDLSIGDNCDDFACVPRSLHNDVVFEFVVKDPDAPVLFNSVLTTLTVAAADPDFASGKGFIKVHVDSPPGPANVPEPSTAPLLLAGVITGAAGIAARRRRSAR